MIKLSLTAKRQIAWFFILTMVAQLATPYSSFALTGGPSQPEVQSFEPIGTSEMVDVSSGSFTYNIPLMDVGGYPINLAYHAGITPDDEASICGLGWNINPGVINRNLRGLPDDFSGDTVTKEFNMKPNKTWGGSLGGKLELFGLSKGKKGGGSGSSGSSKPSFNLSANLGVFYNNYKGIGFEFGIMPGFQAGNKGSITSSFGLGLTANSQSGITISPTASFNKKLSETEKGDGQVKGGISIGSTVNSRTGLSALTIGTSLGISAGEKYKDKKGKDQTETHSRSLLSGSSKFSFATPTYAPSAALPFRSFSFSTSGSIGFEVTGLHPGGSLSGYYSEQSLATNNVVSGAYGYLYAHNRGNSRNTLADFNREKDGPFTKYTKHLPPVIPANDIYGVTGQGIAGSYQLKRGDIGVYSDAVVFNPGAGVSLGFEIGVGAPPGVHYGGDIVVNATNSRSGAWKENNDAAAKLGFHSPLPNSPEYEAAYFKIAGEKSVETDPDLYKQNGGKDPVRVHLEKKGAANMNVKADALWETEGNVKYPITKTKRSHRERRNQSITYLTAAEAANFALETSILDYPLNNFNSAPAKINRTGGTAPQFRSDHHLSEITTLRQDGLRYIYGIPAYNWEQQEVSFSISGNGDCKTGLIPYAPNTDDSKNNPHGEENYYNRTTIPAYAHSYLLTAIVSQDYVDLTGDGPTPDDYGAYTKFNYSRVETDYRWRIPVEAGFANFNEGLKSDTDDNKANYLAGQKEYWVLHSVVSKTQVAHFEYGLNRTDAQSATKQKLPRLISITLYARPDWEANGLNAATPIKQVWFEYDQSLCPGLPNGNNGGKLTLTKLWFTYGKSQKGKLSPYRFEYGQYQTSQGEKKMNPPYGLKNYNRWGSYQENKSAGTGCYLSPDIGPLNTSDYPYVPQDAAQADSNAHAYNLTTIHLPSGGKIRVQYEANRYAYTQDRRAMEMVDIIGAGAAKDTTQFNPGALQSSLISTLPWVQDNGFLQTGNNFLFFKLRKTVASQDEFKRRYLHKAFGDKSMSDGYLYFKFLVRVNSVFSPSPQYEYVPGYAQIRGGGALQKNSQTGQYEYGYIELKGVPVQDFKLPEPLPNISIPSPHATNPIAKTAWQFNRLYLPEIAYGHPLAPTGSDMDVITALASMATQMNQFVVGFNNAMLTDGLCREFVPGKSWLRLCNPERNKIAGGARVKSIRISDAWGNMDQANGSSFEYGQDYDYTSVENGDTISSGVAAYEPMLGGEENPFRQPQVFSDRTILAPSNEYYQEEPFGESFFPSPQIVYAKVTVRNRPHTNVKRTATGSVVHEFYTARDFPTKTDDTGVRSIPKKTNPVFRQLLLKHKDYMTAAEGFAIELNDMHGKPKAQWVFDESGARISGVEYRYKRQGDRLINEGIPVVFPDGSIRPATIGLDFSMATDSREMYSKTITAGVQLNSDNFLAGVYPILTFIPLPSYHSEETRFRSMIATKVIQRYGLLEETIAYDLGASVSTKNLAWDAETGEVLLTETYNEFGDPLFSFNIPAHWGYEGMRGAYQNIGARFSGISISNGIYKAGALQQFFTPGDELMMTMGNNTVAKVWVKDVSRNTGDVYLIDQSGQAVGTNLTLQGVQLKNLRSGRRNQQLNSIGSIASLKKPVSPGNRIDFTGKEILQAGAVEYSDRWQTWCVDQDNECANFPPKSVNPYRSNNRGVFRPLRNWAYLTDRKQNAAGVDIRTDGAFQTFTAFWQPPAVPINAPKDPDAAPVWQPNPAGWTWTTEITRYNPAGNELENRDTLNRYSAELIGYANTQVTAVAQNARYRQIAFDGFEDYEYDKQYANTPCHRRHFGFDHTLVQDDASHSGKYALLLTPGATTSAKDTIKSPLPDCRVPLAPKPANQPFQLDECDCVGVFSPDPGTYVFSAWVREDRDAFTLNYNKASVTVISGGQQQVFQASGPIIEGWQRIYGEFVVPQGAKNIEIKLTAAPDVRSWFDDLRIHPFDASFKSFVYDDISLRFTYELDENNFFTKYEYDQQGMLERVKKETVRGVMTIQESYFGQQKKQ